MAHESTPESEREVRIQNLLCDLGELSKSRDPEGAHPKADQALLAFINDPRVTQAFHEVPKWYS